MRTLFILIRWVLGCFLCFASIGGFLSGEGGSAFFVLLLGLILIPPIAKLIFPSKKQSKMNAVATKPGQDKVQDAPISLPSHTFDQMAHDNFILDVTGEESIIPAYEPSTGKGTAVVPWNHLYISSIDDLNKATKAQQDYYHTFKKNFLEGVYLDLQGYFNYALILLYDLLAQFDQTKDIEWLEKQVDNLGLHYPRTYSYTRTLLLAKMGSINDINGIRRVKMQMAEGNPHNSYEYEWALGKVFKDKLKLDKDSELLLNKIWYQGNNFYGIPFCQEQILKLFVCVITNLKSDFTREGTSIEQQFDIIGDMVARKHFKYRLNSNNYIYSLQELRKELYILILKYCENKVRDQYGHKRKLSVDSYSVAKTEIEVGVLQKVEGIIAANIGIIEEPDQETELELNVQNTTRWKLALEKLEQMIPVKPVDWFLQEVLLLGARNKKNPSVESIFYEASKMIAKKDKVTALILYLHYIDHDLKSKEFDNKPIAKTIQKSLFNNLEQVHDFEIIIQNLIETKDLDNAIVNVRKFYETKRRKIQLDQELIDAAASKYQDTVELLNNLLDEESEENGNMALTEKGQEKESQIVLNINSVADVVNTSSASRYRFGLTPTQASLLQLFAKNNFVLPIIDAQQFAKSNGLFIGSLIESINELHFEYLDDVLIEEEEDVYIINENYYKKILTDEHDN
ncbi:MAG: hypothetical protein JO154_13690 [Chitinophaga sp.]|uniref:tellurite resistance TerB C-terminal domain-containing protein n=1 Tax=Chitinophaga sp. TaxID=1869181 RepID=UPI0025C1C595|nr:tellurite resistance TerB C-terminal domain-containing protein [Chitinophaga sp.]MBV8253655.1 hypothetical protein [Chitinophaga sp.]